jgi:hypothetical protein
MSTLSAALRCIFSCSWHLRTKCKSPTAPVPKEMSGCAEVGLLQVEEAGLAPHKKHDVLITAFCSPAEKCFPAASLLFFLFRKYNLGRTLAHAGRINCYLLTRRAGRGLTTKYPSQLPLEFQERTGGAGKGGDPLEGRQRPAHQTGCC